MDTHNLICDFGRHKGERYTRIPISYLKWMINSNHDKKAIAEAELKRRGTVTPDLELSGHAIDKASLRCLEVWKNTRNENEGLHAWLLRMSAEAMKHGMEGSNKYKGGEDDIVYFYSSMKFVFVKDGVWPVLKTIF